MALRDGLQPGFMDWASQCKDWNAIRDEGGYSTPYDVSFEQVRRLYVRGKRPLTLDKILGEQTSAEDIARDEERLEEYLREIVRKNMHVVK